MTATELSPDTRRQQPSPAFWDGVARGYIPPDRLRIHPTLRLHGDAAGDVDPITYEVIRYSLLNANFEHSAMISRLCVSPVTMLTRDYQASIMVENGDLVFLGPNLQWFSMAHVYSAKWILENRSEAPGIADGDMFLSNDPYIGAAHQPDAMVACPVFVDGRLFCWVANSMHHSDLGGSAPGSFCNDAPDIFLDPICIPALKVMEGGKVRPDVEQLFTRQSRLPGAALMDLRAAISANTATRNKIVGLVERYGADVVKAVMNRTIDASEQTFLERLRSIPDGTWSQRAYTESAVPGDRGIYRYQINIRKEGDVLHVDNEGTDSQAGSINTSFMGFAGQIMTPLCSQMVSDLAGAYGGVHRRVRFHPVPGTLNCADHPAAVSPAGAYTMELNISCATVAIARMLSCGDDAARSLILGSEMAHWACVIYAGLDDDGNYYVMPNTNGMMGAIGGMPGRDGDDVGGHFFVPEGIAYNVEQVERQYPVLYLYRRMLDGGADGAGRHRGGLSFVEGTIPWGGRDMAMALCMNESFPKALGGAGGNPGGRAAFRVRRGAEARAAFAQGRIPQSFDELGGEDENPAFKHAPFLIGDDDAFEWVCPTAAGYGDPLLRDPEAVRADVEGGHFSPETAARVYGVVLTDGSVDAGATDDRRSALFAQRLGRPAKRRDGGAGVEAGHVRVGDALALVGQGTGRRWRCVRCGADVGDGTANYKDGAAVVARPAAQIAPEFASPDPELADQMVFREHCCPSCGVRFDTEISRASEEPLWDVRLS